MVEVDPRLFVTCRLCLDVQGHFQIDPEVQLQIKYCFDIDVQPFDSLPQLICKKCETVLREYHAIKKKFNDKQKELKEKLKGNIRKVIESISCQQRGSESDADKSYSSKLHKSDSSSYGININSKRKKKKVKKKRIRKRFLSSSDDDVEPNDTTVPQINEKVDIHESSENPVTWETNFKKRYVCRICSQGFPTKEEVTRHVKEHTILQKYQNVFKRSCLVVMNKCDSKPNLCNSNNAVVCSSDSIRENIYNPFYGIMYFFKTPGDISNNIASKNNISDNESRCSVLKPRKRKRETSRSSSETVVINRHSEHEDTTRSLCNDNSPTVIDCIDLGDSSDNGSYESNDKSISSKNNETHSSKVMQQIVKMCYSRYAKQVHNLEKKATLNDKVNEDFLQRKVLSIGRKIINNKGFNCTGLLRFLEYRDLGVQWTEANVLNPSSDDKYVRIATTLRINEAKINDVGWKDLSFSQFDSEESKSSANLYKKLKKFEIFRKRAKLISNTCKNQISDSVQLLPRISSVFSHTDLEITKIDSESVLAKILNANPVSNPKQLPKKMITNESYPKNIRVYSASNTTASVCIEQMEKDSNVNCTTTPIIASTISLSSMPVIDQNNIDPPADSVNSSQQPHHPRIKVKPVSELMAKKPNISLNSNTVHRLENGLQISNNIWAKQKIWFNHNNQNNNMSDSQRRQLQNVSFVEPSELPIEYFPSSVQRNALNCAFPAPIISSPAPAKECVLLNSVQFPNTKTSSPFQYFQNLLIVHNITLENASEPSASSLIKLKIVFQHKEESISICLSLACLKNRFYMEFKDLHSNNIDINSLEANWQWQLLRTFNQDEISNKVIQSAKNISLETYQCTRDFFNLLKSIDLINERT